MGHQDRNRNRTTAASTLFSPPPCSKAGGVVGMDLARPSAALKYAAAGSRAGMPGASVAAMPSCARELCEVTGSEGWIECTEMTRTAPDDA